MQDAVKLMQNNSQQSEFELRSILKTTEQFMIENVKKEARKQSDANLKLEQNSIQNIQALELKMANAIRGNFDEADKRIGILKNDVHKILNEFSDTKIQLGTDLKDTKLKFTQFSLLLKENVDREIVSMQDSKNEISEKITKAALDAQDLRKEIYDHHRLALIHADESLARARADISDQFQGAIDTMAEQIAMVDVKLRDNKDRMEEHIDKCHEQGRSLESKDGLNKTQLEAELPSLGDPSAFVTKNYE
jgi:hypothetical protein